MSKIAVIGGGTGFIGRAIVSALQCQGYTTQVISRRDRDLSWEDIESNGLPKGTEVVINVAGRNILEPFAKWNDMYKYDVLQSRVETSKTLAKAVESANPKIFATISGVAYYEPNSQEYTEQSTCQPYDFFSNLVREWESASQLSGACKTRRVIIRSGVVLGRQGGMIQNSILPFFMGLGGPMGSGQQHLPWIHVKDLANLFVFAATNDNVKGVLNGVAPQIITNAEFAKEFAAALNRPALLPMPEFVLKLMFSPERAKIILSGQRVIPKRVMELGFKYEYPDIKSACKEFSHLFYEESE